MLVKATEPKNTKGWRWQCLKDRRLTSQAIGNAARCEPRSSGVDAFNPAGSAGGRCYRYC